MTGILNLLLGAGGVIKDAYFNLVSLLLPGNGTNGAQNNTFLDSGTANSGSGFTITRNGNTTQGTFSPFSQTGWGAYFDGSNDYLGLSTQSILPTGTLEFTIEFWAYKTNAWSTGTQAIITDGGSGGIEIWVDTGNSVLRLGRNGIAAVLDYSYASLTVNSWNHFAYSRKGNDFALWVNGTRVATTTNSNSFATTNGTQAIGAFSAGSSPWAGYLASVRVVRGSYVYDTASSTITVPTSPLTAVTNTTLLTCQYNRFRDASTNNFTVTPNNGTAITPFSPFAPTQPYSAAAVGGSGYFDGTGDYLTIANQTALQLPGDFTIDGWIYGDNSGNNTGSAIIGDYFRNNAEATSQYQIAWNETNKAITFYLKTSGGSTSLSTSNGTAPPFSWNHFALVRSGSTIRLYCNGVGTSTATDSTQLNSGFGTWIGVDANNTSEIFGGYIANLRVVKGTAIYDPSQSTLTVPTALTTAVSGTSLLLNFTNAGVVDATAKNVLETVGNAQISTTQSKWGGGSVYFDGNGDNLAGPASVDLDMGTGNWTIEGWVNITTRTLNYPSIISNNNGSFSAGALSLQVSNADSASYNDRFVLGVYDLGGTRNLVSSVANSTGVWYYFAVVRNGTNLSIYRDGTSVASTTISSGLTFNWGKLGLRVGGGNWDGAQSYLNGYLDDLRITKGVARTITASPTAPFPVQ